MTHPIIMAAFGTSTRAMQTYGVVANAIREEFPENELIWAFTSRYVRPHMKRKGLEIKSPQQVLANLQERGISWAVVQSFHISCGHEFHRLVTETSEMAIRVSAGHSLLCAPEDHLAVIDALAPIMEKDPQEAVVFVGHGTDHCIWTTYLAFESLLQRRFGQRVWVGVVEGECPDQDEVIHAIAVSGFKRVRLVPLMLVAGVHFKEDLAGREDSWQAAFEKQGIHVSLESDGLGMNPKIARIFCDHIRQALDLIPAMPE